MTDLGVLADQIEACAKQRGFVMFKARADSIGLPAGFVDWEGFLDMGAKVGVHLLYGERKPLDLDVEAAAAMKEASFAGVTEDDEPIDWTEREWIRERFASGTHDRRSLLGKTARISFQWFHQSVCHGWEMEAEWYEEFKLAMQAIAEDSLLVDRENRRLRKADKAKQYSDQAEQLATHPRWPRPRAKPSAHTWRKQSSLS